MSENTLWKTLACVGTVYVLAAVAFWAVAIYAAIHFIGKVW